MGVAKFEGIVVEGGRIRLTDDVELPEHTKVVVLVPGFAVEGRVIVAGPRLAHAEDAAEFVMQIIDGPADAGL